MSIRDSYHAYTEGSVFSGSPLEMVVALYEGTINAIRQARHCLATGDVWGRSRAINKGMKLLTELLVSLENPEGNEISANLKALYSYIQARLLDAHTKKSGKALDEAERLLSTILEGWREAAEKSKAETDGALASVQSAGWDGETTQNHAWNYGFFAEVAEFAGGVSAVF